MFSKRQGYGDREQISGCQGMGEGSGWLTIKEQQEVRGEGPVLYPVYGICAWNAAPQTSQIYCVIISE